MLLKKLSVSTAVHSVCLNLYFCVVPPIRCPQKDLVYNCPLPTTPSSPWKEPSWESPVSFVLLESSLRYGDS